MNEPRVVRKLGDSSEQFDGSENMPASPAQSHTIKPASDWRSIGVLVCGVPLIPIKGCVNCSYRGTAVSFEVEVG